MTISNTSDTSYGLIFLTVLVIMFMRWNRSRRNYITILYLISSYLISVSVIVSAIYLEYQFSLSYSIYRKPYPIHSYVERQETRPLIESLATIFDIIYLFIIVLFYLDSYCGTVKSISL